MFGFVAVIVGQVSQRLFHCVVKRCDEKQLGKKRVYLGLCHFATLRSYIITEQSRGGNGSSGLGGTLLSRLLLLDHPACFLVAPRTTCPGDHHPHWAQPSHINH